MSLNFQLSGIEDYKTVCYDGDGQLKVLTEAIIWATMIVEIGKITEENVGEFYARLKVCEGLGKLTHMRGDGTPMMPKIEELIAHIGLYTNVPEVHRPRWLTRQHGQVMGQMDEIERSVKYTLKGKS